MKKLSILLVIGSAFFLSATKAQSTCSGVFLTANDFSTGNLYYAYAGKNASNAYASNLLTKKRIVINESGSTRQVDKKDIYAVQSCDGKIVRIYKGGYYTLLNPGEKMPIYMVTINPASKGDVATTKYYFSKNSKSDIRVLTLNNLEAEFPDFHQFNDAMKAVYKTDKEIFANLYTDDNFPKASSTYIRSDEK